MCFYNMLATIGYSKFSKCTCNMAGIYDDDMNLYVKFDDLADVPN